MSKSKNYRGHNCVACNREGRKPIKLARMACQQFKSKTKTCGAFVCDDHGHHEKGRAYCNECRPYLFDIAPLKEDLVAAAV